MRYQLSISSTVNVYSLRTTNPGSTHDAGKEVQELEARAEVRHRQSLESVELASDTRLRRELGEAQPAHVSDALDARNMSCFHVCFTGS